MEVIVERIKKLANIRNTNIRAVAAKINMSFSGLYATLGNRSLKVSTLLHIAEVLRVSPIYFFTEDENLKDHNIEQFKKDISSFSIRNYELLKELKELRETNKRYLKIIDKLTSN